MSDRQCSYLIWSIKFTYNLSLFHVMITANVNWFNLYWNELNSFFSLSSFHLHSSVKIYVRWLSFISITVYVCVCACESEHVFLLLTSMSNERKEMWQFSLLFNFTVMETSRSLMCDFGWIRVCERLYSNGSVYILTTRMWVCACVSECSTLNWRLNVGAAIVNRLTRDLINTIEIFDYLFKSPSPNYVCMCVH